MQKDEKTPINQLMGSMAIVLSVILFIPLGFNIIAIRTRVSVGGGGIGMSASRRTGENAFDIINMGDVDNNWLDLIGTFSIVLMALCGFLFVYGIMLFAKGESRLLQRLYRPITLVASGIAIAIGVFALMFMREFEATEWGIVGVGMEVSATITGGMILLFVVGGIGVLQALFLGRRSKK